MDPVPKIVDKKPHVVFIPFPTQSHIKCMLKLARLLHQNGIYITFINTHTNHKRLVDSAGLEEAPGFWFKTVPDGLSSATDDGVKPTEAITEIVAYLATNFFDCFLDVVSGLENPITCMVCDGFMTFTKAIDAAEKLKVPVMLFWTMAACGFMGFYQVKVLTEKEIIPLKDESYLRNGYLDMEIDWIPGMEGIRLKDLPEFTLATSSDDPMFRFFMGLAQEAHKVSHMIIHTFEELEARLVGEIKSIFPNVYTIGPLQLLLDQTTVKETNNRYSLWKEEPECVQWLKTKEPNSVVYVNFGSLAVMSVQDLLEFGWGLVNSNHYFLWIIRTDLVDGKPLVFPQELEEAINKKGFIGSWCSQEEVLNHPAVGGFLTHCGWGSIIESLSAGVPMLCWPSIGDQRTNCRQTCKEWEVGMEISRNVKRDEVEKLVRALMEGLEGKIMRKKALEWKKMAEIATDSNGSSRWDTKNLADEINRLSRN
ncbi:putative UDP-glucuronosyl/UDP-glucosyltransferase, UDP-glycosyltransferase family [Helianthus annuus]|uniref:Glycosyltransferase n=1 Tax=Helianthus annuus TaxID=4232 RepID=A0A251VBB2_HELAN|nr:UDP-glycosyltransferase 85C1 [Helianthus annuus]KAF5815454.1 putative UDP-glucuronosyl/UDP-glucosyltransferase, UDP-glycosyltransferase family [Helianthus annuus]KAJ0601984.1 putative UDP-glucuronosyl/UDP-glucosyltransferase, UDP-glycosyltransferase family [Helianthus annuus]KAJ0774753.1 putative UDP-glucuronosyl/UDP-glucosyltransferase, UDP-glycosyltransferase family [Helianthus annuus]KAJ0802247.1 putative UDP-glucuronosyl/UDP-glucosyltransferase, UDP-glycosyltransferase family [Helianthus